MAVWCAVPGLSPILFLYELDEKITGALRPRLDNTHPARQLVDCRPGREADLTVMLLHSLTNRGAIRCHLPYAFSPALHGVLPGV